MEFPFDVQVQNCLLEFRGITRLDGARGKKQVWRLHVRTWGDIVVTFRRPRGDSAPPLWFGTPIVIRHPHCDSAPGELLPPCPPMLRLCFSSVWKRTITAILFAFTCSTTMPTLNKITEFTKNILNFMCARIAAIKLFEVALDKSWNYLCYCVM